MVIRTTNFRQKLLAAERQFIVDVVVIRSDEDPIGTKGNSIREWKLK
jgi:hypothetical protein